MGKVFPGYQSQADLSNINLQTGAPISSAQPVIPRGYIDEYGSGTSTMQQTSPAQAGLGDPVNYNPGQTYSSDGQDFIIDQRVAKDGQSVQRFWKKAPTGLAKYIGEGAAGLVGKAAIPAAVAGLVYALSPEEQGVADQLEELALGNPDRRDYDLWKNLPDKNTEEAQQLKAKWYGQPAYSASQLASSFGANALAGITPGTPGAPAFVASGGEVMGWGTGTSDSIPARLSDGEFVMTAQAVRNAGGGNRNLGAARMYDMMNRFERGVA
jgi:hypothetical protein